MSTLQFKHKQYSKTVDTQLILGLRDTIVYNNTVRPNTVAGFASHVRLERPIDSSSDKLSVHRS